MFSEYLLTPLSKSPYLDLPDNMGESIKYNLESLHGTLSHISHSFELKSIDLIINFVPPQRQGFGENPCREGMVSTSIVLYEVIVCQYPFYSLKFIIIQLLVSTVVNWLHTRKVSGKEKQIRG